MEKRSHRWIICGLFLLLLGISLACQLSESVGNIKSAVESADTIQKTVSNLVTNIPPGFEKTAQAAITQMLPENFDQTAVAAITQMGSEEMQKTLDAGMEQLGNLIENNPPADIPLLENRKDNYSMSQELVSYTSETSYQETLEFYKTRMPENGWTYVPDGSAEADDAAVLNYTKDNRKAVVTLSHAGALTVVMVTLTAQ